MRQRLSKHNEENIDVDRESWFIRERRSGMKSTEVELRIYPLRASGYAGTSLLSSANLVWDGLPTPDLVQATQIDRGKTILHFLHTPTVSKVMHRIAGCTARGSESLTRILNA